MMKRNVVVSAFLFLMSSFVSGVWKVGTIVNSSDLVLESAWYEKPSLTKITHLTTKLQQSKSLPKPVSIEFNYTVADTANGHSIIKAQGGYQLTLDDNLTHFIQSGRTKVKRKCVSKYLSGHKNYRHLAQLFLEVLSPGDDQLKDVKCAVHGYEQDTAVFDIVLSGAKGNYAITLKPV